MGLVNLRGRACLSVFGIFPSFSLDFKCHGKLYYYNGNCDIMSDIFVLGTGLLAEEFFSLVTHAGVGVAAFVENLDPNKSGTVLCGRPVIWVEDLPPQSLCICAISSTKRRTYIEQVSGRAIFTTFVHPSSLILPPNWLGDGSVISTGVLVASNTRIGSHVFVNRGVRIGHHTSIGNLVTVQPGANIAGRVEVGESSYIGMGAIIVERLRIGKGAIVAAGAVVIKDVPDHSLVAGNPAVVKKVNIDIR